MAAQPRARSGVPEEPRRAALLCPPALREPRSRHERSGERRAGVGGPIAGLWRKYQERFRKYWTITTAIAPPKVQAATLRNAKMVCTRIPVSCRHDALSWTHHCEVGLAFSDHAEIERWLVVAETERLSTSALRRRVRLHVASRGGVAPNRALDSSVSAFRLMRELRAVGRSLARERHSWRRWSPGGAQLALEELSSITGFVDEVRSRALAASTPLPRDLSLN